MHGQKRSEYKARLLHPDTRVKLGSKAKQWNHLSDELLKQRRRLFTPSDDEHQRISSGAEDEANDATGSSPSPSPEVLLALTEKMLSVNPDPSHLWNIRREMLVHILQSSETQPTAVKSDTTTTSTDTADNKEEEKDVAVEGSVLQNSANVLDIQGELKLTAHCLQRNPKAYSTWFHRKWALVYYMTASSSTSSHSAEQDNTHWTDVKSILASELELCGQFLQLDERNFHCWNFRRFVVGLLGSCGGSAMSTDDNESDAHDSTVTSFSGDWSWWLQEGDNEVLMMGPQISKNACSAVGMGKRCERTSTVNKPTYPLSTQELEKIIMNEWDFTTSKIQDNFSNGSAFHYRSKLLPLILKFRSSSPCHDGHEAISLVRDEWDNILLDAIFTEPDDQTVWFYHRFIVSWAMHNIANNNGAGEDNADVLEEYEGLLYDMVDSIQELIDVEKEDSLQGNDGSSRHESKGAKCKWALLGMHLVLSTLMELKSHNSGEENDEESSELHARAGDCLAELIIIDPDRRERYQILKSELK
ncbi:hypothetical protein ACHAWC_006081 [Mediolabrus comicus]